MSMESLIKQLQNIMRGDDLAGTVQYLKQMIWMIFLKIYDAQEEKWEILEDDYTSIIPDELKWRSWAIDHKDGKALTGDELIKFVNEKLIEGLKKLEVNEYTPKRHYIVWQMFQDASNFMKNGTKLRQMINALNEKDFTNATDTHEFGDMYESMLKDLQESKRDGGEFYTPRALTDFIVEKVDPNLGEKVADFACGTGGFLVSALKHLTAKVQTTEDLDLCRHNLHGVEKKSFPYSLCMTNMILHDVDDPNIVYGNSLNKNVREIKDSEKFDVILMNPPYGGIEDEIIQMNFPQEFRCSETANLFMALIMYRLNSSGRVGVVLSDSFLEGSDNSELNLKKKLLSEFNLHSVIRLPKSVFAPYTNIATNVLFFEKDDDGTKNTWFYRMDIPSDRKAFSKTKPIKSEHFQPIRDWWNNREEIQDEDGNFKARRYSREEIVEGNYNLDLCGFPHKVEEILEPKELIENYETSQKKLISEIFDLLAEFSRAITNVDYHPQQDKNSNLNSALDNLVNLNVSLDDQLKKSVLQYAVQGKLVPQNPDDEPASVLLDRIREEKSRLIAEGKIKRDKNESVIFRNADGQYIERIGNTEKDISDEIPFEIPENWEWTRFSFVAEIARGGSPRPIKSFLTDAEDGVNWIKIGDTQKGSKYINSVKEKIKPSGVSKSRMVKKGDFLLTNSMSFGRPYITNVEGCIHDGWLVISPFIDTYNSDFLFYLLSSPFAFNQFSDKVSGAVVKNLNTDKVLNALIPLPPRAEQKRIVERIDQILSLYK